MATRREFLKQGIAAGAAAGAAAVLERAALGLPVSEQGPAAGQSAGLAAPLQEFAYGDVQLAPGRAQSQFEQTQAVLLGMDNDSLLRPWRERAGMMAPGTPLGGWYEADGFCPAHAFGQ